MQKHKYLMASTEYYWEKISNGSYDFTRREQNTETVMTLTQADMLQFYDSFVAINSSSRSKLSVQIWSSQGIKSAENVITSDLKNISSSDEKSGEDMMDVDTVLTDDGSVAEMRNQWLLGRSGYPMADIRTFYSF
ncbi:hypothetical protein HDU99_008511 [Rhizoclosmatium hyalinum]|nr:hypothetical protein HDU99_008511 [Rhizoclosmatium hyalinum]